MSDNSKLVWGVLGGVLLGAFGAAVVKRSNLRPQAAKIPSYGYDIKDALVEQAETWKENCEDLAAEAKEKYEDRKAEVGKAEAPVCEQLKKAENTEAKAE